MNRITTKFLQQQYDIIAKKYNIQVKELPAKEFMLNEGTGNRRYLLRQSNYVGCFGDTFSFDTGFCERHSIYRRCILINSGFRNYTKFITLYHEAKHVQCVQSGCFCYTGYWRSRRKRVYQELHAHCAELELLINRKMWKLLAGNLRLFDELCSDKWYERFGEEIKFYQTSAQMLKRSKIWKEAKRLVSVHV